MSQYPDIHLKVQQANFLNAEYVQQTRGGSFEGLSEESMSVQSSTFGTSSTSMRSVMKKITFSNLLIRETNTNYRIFNYIVSVHLATWSSLWYSVFIVMLPYSEGTITIRLVNLIIACIVDLVFIGKMFVDSHLTYVEPESGILVTDMSLIRKRYFLSLRRFWFDLFTTIPVNLIIKLMRKDEYVRYGYINRVFKWFYLVMYYAQEERELNVKQHLRWTYLIYTMMLNIQTAVCVW